MKNKQPSFQPVVEDNNGIIRKQFDDLQSKVRISKKRLQLRFSNWAWLKSRQTSK